MPANQPKPDCLPTMKEIIMARKYQDEEMCIQIIVQKIWGREPMCPRCGKHPLRLYNNKGHRYMACTQVTRCFTASPYQGTMYHGSFLSKLKWFEAIDLVYKTNGAITPPMLARKLEITHGHALKLIMKINHELGFTGVKRVGNINRGKSNPVS